MRHEPVQDCVVLEGADDAEVSVFTLPKAGLDEGDTEYVSIQVGSGGSSEY
jgi:hypothetical protein